MGIPEESGSLHCERQEMVSIVCVALLISLVSVPFAGVLGLGIELILAAWSDMRTGRLGLGGSGPAHRLS